MLSVSDSKEAGKRYFDLAKIKTELEKYSSEISKCEIYFNANNTEISNLPDNCFINHL